MGTWGINTAQLVCLPYPTDTIPALVNPLNICLMAGGRLYMDHVGAETSLALSRRGEKSSHAERHGFTVLESRENKELDNVSGKRG